MRSCPFVIGYGMDHYQAIKILHIISSTILFGTGLGIAFFMFCSRYAKNIHEKYYAARFTVFADYVFTAPAVVLQPLTGMWLVLNGGYDSMALWLKATYVLYILAGTRWLNTFVDEVHHSSPPSVIDRARETVTYALLAYFNLQKEDVVDLGKLVRRLEIEERVIAKNAADIINRLHARAKPAEQEKRVLRPVREQDADLAVQCVGALLCEIGLAEWA